MKISYLFKNLATKSKNILLNLETLRQSIDQLAYNLGLIADYVIESGTSGMWTYRKWNSGTSECWGIYAVANLRIDEQWGNLYEKRVTTALSFPQNLFIDSPVLTLGASGLAGFIEQNGRVYASNTNSFYWCRPNVSQGDVYLNMHAIGRWK